MKRALLTVALLLAVAPTAEAAPFGEPPFRAAGGTATCLRATGYPGELVRSTATGAQFLQAGAGGLVPVADVTGGARTSSCPQAAARPNGVGVVAFASYEETGGESVVRAALREPGGAWSSPVEIATVPRFADGQPIAADSSERGDALVAFAGSTEAGPIAVTVVRRAPGATFGAPETLFTAPGKGELTEVRVAAGLSASGEAVVAWSFQPKAGKPREVWGAVAAAGAAFAAPARTGAGFSLAVGSGGHALLAFPSGADLLVAERAPGGSFGAGSRVGAATDRLVVYPAAAVRPDGGAVVAWQNALAGDLQAVVRTQPGPFSAPVALAPKSGLRYPKSILDLYDAFGSGDAGEITTDGAAPDRDSGFPRALITPDGRAVVTGEGVARDNGVWFGAPRVATIPLAGGAPESHLQGEGLRDAGTITPLVTADGMAAIAWTDNNDRARDGRLHLEVEGAPDGADPAAPDVRLIGSRHRVLKPNEELRFAVRCSSACDVRVQLGDGLLAATDDVALARAGETQIVLGGLFKPLATLKGGPVKVLLRYGAPGARRATTKTVTFNLRRLPDAPRPPVLDPVARHVGKAVVITWRSDGDAKPSNFFAYATKTRDDSPGLFETYVGGDVGDLGVTQSGRRFRLRLEDVKTARYVHVVAHVENARKTDTTTVRIRG
jgi:hypothetical protein